MSQVTASLGVTRIVGGQQRTTSSFGFACELLFEPFRISLYVRFRIFSEKFTVFSQEPEQTGPGGQSVTVELNSAFAWLPEPFLPTPLLYIFYLKNFPPGAMAVVSLSWGRNGRLVGDFGMFSFLFWSLALLNI